jgi:hypothetical protein
MTLERAEIRRNLARSGTAGSRFAQRRARPANEKRWAGDDTAGRAIRRQEKRRNVMGLVSILIFAFILVAGLLGLWAQRILPEEQKSDGARAMVGQVAGVVSLLLALVLGTLVGTSYAFFSGQKTAVETLSSQILLLDEALGQYGPETKPARDRLKDGTQIAYNTFWGTGDSDTKLLSVDYPLSFGTKMKAFLATLKPETDAQRSALASAGALTTQIEQGRLLLALQVASHPVSPGLLGVLVVWAVILFFGMGLFVRANALVVSALSFGSLCVSFAIFLVLELGLPYTGVFRVSGAALKVALDTIGH